MPKNKGAGGKKFRKGKTETNVTKRELEFKEDGQEYGYVTKMLGSCNVSLECADGTTRIGHVRGAMRKKVWVKISDTVLCGLRDYEDGKCDIVHVYDPDEVRCLSSYGELPTKWDASASNADNADPNDDSGNVSFAHDTNEDGKDFSIDDI